MKPAANTRYILVSVVFMAVCLGGCTKRPDNTALLRKQAEATKHMGEAGVRFTKAEVQFRKNTATHAKAVKSNQEATKWVTLLVPAVESLLLRVPEELRAEVEVIKVQVKELSLAIEATAGPLAENTRDMAETQASLTLTKESIAAANQATNEVNTNFGPAYFEEVKAIVASEEAKSRRLTFLATWGALIVAVCAGYASTRHVKISVPATWAMPAAVFGVVYVASFLAIRFWPA